MDKIEIKPKQVLLEILKKHYQIEQIRGSNIIALNSKAILYLRTLRCHMGIV